MSAARPLQERLAESRVDLVAYAEGDLVERDWLPAVTGCSRAAPVTRSRRR